ncbi:MAG: tyrosine-type recombinase/integrase [Caldilineaceae bacterium]|nr:tyrosine-type recombinase/integrase [Caldilineaceae bacterium]
MREKIALFLQFLTAEKDCTENTLAAYSTDAYQFYEFTQSNSDLIGTPIEQWADVSPQIAQIYLEYMRDKEGYAASTVARKMAVLKSFFHFLVQAQVIAENPIVELELPKVTRQKPRAISPKHIERLLEKPAEHNTPKALRDQALMELLYTTGIRITELIRLSVHSVDLENGVLKSDPGSRRVRIIALPQRSLRVLERYLKEGRPHLLVEPDEESLFLNHRGQGLTRQGLWLIIKGYVEETGLQDVITPHTLRHSFAANLINAGADWRKAGHRSPSAEAKASHARHDAPQGKHRRPAEEPHEADAEKSAHFAEHKSPTA